MTIIRHSGVVFEGEQGRKYASAIARIVHSVQTGLEDVSGGHDDGVSKIRCIIHPVWALRSDPDPCSSCPVHRTTCGS